MKHILLIIFITGFAITAHSQNKYKKVRGGNQYYDNSAFRDAELFYKEALVKDPTYAKAMYNLGNSLYKQKHFDEAIRYYSMAIESTDEEIKQEALYNTGNIFLEKAIKNANRYAPSTKDLEKAIETYSEVLKMDPNLSDARYNLAYALQMKNKLDQQQQQKNQKEQEKNNDQKEKKETSPNENENPKDSENQKDNKSPEKAEAERILEAIKSNEKKVLDRQKVKIRGVSSEKDW